MESASATAAPEC